jgi:CRISPR-associated protein (TIGR03986 family)
MIKGRIVMLFDSYGFIEPLQGGDEVFFHRSSLKDARFADLDRGTIVDYEAEKREKGLRATAVRPAAGIPKYRFHNPYNFVQYLPERCPDCHVLGNCPPPPHDRYMGLTGRITCKVAAVTPLFISDSHAVAVEKGKGKEKGHKTYRFFQYEGRPALPASSLRGMIRSVFESLTNSCFTVFQLDEPYPLEHRMSRAPEKIMPARVVELDEQGAVLELLDCTVKPPGDISGYPTVISSGAVCQVYPPQVLNQKTNSVFDPSQSKLPAGDYHDGMRVAALVTRQPVNHWSGRFRSFHVTKVVPADKHQSLTEDEQHLKVFGWLHLTGPNIENKHDERLFFRWDDQQPDPLPKDQVPTFYLYRCSDDIVQEYNHHLKGYWERHEKTVDELGNRRWPNSVVGMPQPSSFVEQGRKLRAGDLVYALCKNGKYTKVKRLRPVCMPRIRYDHPRQKLLPGHLLRCESYNKLCPACRVFGWVHESAGKGREDSRQLVPIAYAGRVRFSHGKIEGEYETENEATLTILSTPKPTTTAFYLLNAEGKPDPTVTYDTDKTRLRGRKFYRNHGKANPDEYRFKEKSDQNRTVRGALRPGAAFNFTVDVEKHAPLELGALLYSLELENGMVHRLGYAKPLGFGSVNVTVEKIKIIDWKKRLASIEPDTGWEPASKDGYKQDFLKKMYVCYGEKFNNLLAELRSLLGTPPDLPVHYPRPSKRLDTKKYPQYEWFVGNNRRIRRGKGVSLGLATDVKNGLPLIDKNGNIRDR